MPRQTFILNGERVKVSCPDDVRVLWVLRDLLGVRGPKYGCGIGACQACTSHLNGKAVNICCIPVGRLKRSDEITTIEGLAQGSDLHPMQEAWLNHDVSQCGFCQPGQIMAAVSKVNEVKGAEGRRRITDRDIDEIRNICRCGTYPRIREAIKEGSANMEVRQVDPRKKKRRKGNDDDEGRKRRRRRRRERERDPRTAEPAPTATPTPTPTPAPGATAPNRGLQDLTDLLE